MENRNQVLWSSVLVALSLAGCASASQGLRPDGASAGKATITFVADLRSGSEPWLVYDEHGHYLGTLTGRFRFEAEVDPGDHVFAAAPFLSGRTGCVSVTVTFASGSHHEARLEEARRIDRKGEPGDTVATAGMLRIMGGQHLVSALAPSGVCPTSGPMAVFALH